jgi:hypothetical protein
VSQIVSEIAAASREQSAGIEQVNKAVTSMDEVTQQNAALVEEAAAAAESMQEQAGTLVQSVGTFKLAHAATGNHVIERRGPDRAKNVARIPAASRSARGAAKPMASSVPAPRKAVGAADEWTEF